MLASLLVCSAVVERKGRRVGFEMPSSPCLHSYQLRPGGLEHSEEIPVESETLERSPDEGALPSLCLKQVYPKYAKQFNHLRLVERIAGLFIRFLGVKGNMRLGPTAFRTFIRYTLIAAGAPR